jgi:protein-S-isoprenylcysteine O-methyltransferase Ste14
MGRQTVLRAISVLSFIAALAIWRATFERTLESGPLPPPDGPVVLLTVTLVPLPVILIGRWILDRSPTADRAAWVTTFVHYAVAIPLGVAIIVAVAAGLVWPCSYNGWIDLPCPSWPTALGAGLVAIAGLALLSTVANLALRGLGAPFAIALTKRLATSQLYSWTRNPMVLAGLAFLVSIGIWFRSWWFIGWTGAFVLPVMAVFLKVYEERELEIRFGEPYIAYKRQTSMLLPRRPRR